MVFWRERGIKWKRVVYVGCWVAEVVENENLGRLKLWKMEVEEDDSEEEGREPLRIRRRW